MKAVAIEHGVAAKARRMVRSLLSRGFDAYLEVTPLELTELDRECAINHSGVSYYLIDEDGESMCKVCVVEGKSRGT